LPRGRNDVSKLSQSRLVSFTCADVLSVKGTGKVKLSLSSGTWGVEVQLYSRLTTAKDAVLIFNKQPLLTRRSLSIAMPFATPGYPENVRRYNEPQHLSGCGVERTTPVYNYLLLIYSVLCVFLALFYNRRLTTSTLVAINVTTSSIHSFGKVYAEPFRWTKTGSHVLPSKLHEISPGTYGGEEKVWGPPRIMQCSTRQSKTLVESEADGTTWGTGYRNRLTRYRVSCRDIRSF